MQKGTSSLGVQKVASYGHMVIAYPEKRSLTYRANTKPVMVTRQNLGKQLMLKDGKLDGRDVLVLLDTGSETSIRTSDLIDPSPTWSRCEGALRRCPLWSEPTWLELNSDRRSH